MANACGNCGETAFFLCSRCGEPYCSAKCQILNWRTHKLSCLEIPYLVPLPPAGDYSLHVNNGAIWMKDASNDTKQIVNRGGEIQKKLQIDFGSNVNKVSFTDSAPEAQVSRACDNGPKVSNRTEKVEPAVLSSVATVNNGWKIVHVPPMKEFFNVVVHWVDDLEPTIAWVTQMKHEPALVKLIAAMQTAVTNSHSIPVNSTEIHLGALVAAAQQGIFYRAKVLGIKTATQTATLRFIDYGKIATLMPISKLYTVVAELQNDNAYAFRIRVPKNVVPLTMSAVLTVRVVNAQAPDGIYVVEVKPDALLGTLPIEFLNLRTGVVLKKVFPDGKHGLIQLQLRCINLDMNALLNSEQAFKYDFNSVPTEASFVAARSHLGWSRAILLGSLEQGLHLVYVVDEGEMRFASAIRKLPNEYIKHPARILLISNAEGQLWSLKNYLDSQQAITLKFGSNICNQKDIKDVTCYLGESKIAVKASCFPTTDGPWDIKYWVEPICDQNLVVVTMVESFEEIYITTYQTTKYVNYFAEMVKKCELYSDRDPISKGDIVLAKCDASGNYFRAEVLAIHKNTNDLKIINMDTGITKVFTRGKLWKANRFVRFCPVYTQKVKLAYLCGVRAPFTDNKALALLKEYQTNNIEFKVKFGSADKTVELFYSNGAEKESLNKKLLPLVFEQVEPSTKETTEPIQLVDAAPMEQNVVVDTQSTIITPTVEQKSQSEVEPKSEQRIKTKVFLEEIDVIPMITGDDVEIYVLDTSTLLTEKYITACNYSRENLRLMKKYIHTSNKYCNGPDAVKGYAPERSEICLVKYDEDGNWYRAICIRGSDVKFEIMFLDFGNSTEVDKNNIVKMPKTEEFMFPSLANLVKLSDCSKDRIIDFIKKVDVTPTYGCKLIKCETTDESEGDSYEIVF